MKNENPANFSLKSRLKSFRFAFAGLKSMLKKEHNSRIHLTAALIAIFAGVILKIDLTEWALLSIVISMVFITELFNSALEAVADRVDPEINELIGRAKDYAAAAVLISAIVAVITGCIIFIPKLTDLFSITP